MIALDALLRASTVLGALSCCGGPLLSFLTLPFPLSPHAWQAPVPARSYAAPELHHGSINDICSHCWVVGPGPWLWHLCRCCAGWAGGAPKVARRRDDHRSGSSAFEYHRRRSVEIRPPSLIWTHLRCARLRRDSRFRAIPQGLSRRAPDVAEKRRPSNRQQQCFPAFEYHRRRYVVPSA